MLDKSAWLTYTMFRKAKDLALLEVPAFGPFNRYIVWAGKPAKESAPEQIGEGRVHALADPARGGAIRFKVLRLVCGHPPKSGSGHGRRMCRPLRFRCAAANSLSCRSGRRGERVRHDKPDRLAKGPYDYLLGG